MVSASSISKYTAFLVDYLPHPFRAVFVPTMKYDNSYGNHPLSRPPLSSESGECRTLIERHV